ncbi:type VI secretion system baseplate subunit TssK, partial [Aduncisulcus paluster]
MHADKPLFWHQGLFLQPQHFQLSDLHQLHRFRAMRQYGLPYFWGVSGLKGAWEEGGKPFTVYLGLRKWNPEGGNVAQVEDTAASVNTMFA